MKNDLPRPGYCPKGVRPCHILEGDSALDYSGRCLGCGDKRAITFDEQNQTEADAARLYLIKEGLDPDQLVKEGLVFINSIHERIRLESLNKELLNSLENLRAAFVVAVGDKSPFAKVALNKVDTVIAKANES